MAQQNSTPEGQPGIAPPAPPPWISRTTPYAPERRARMLEHMARARSHARPQAAMAAGPSGMRGGEILRDAFGYMVLFGIIALLAQSRIPLYLAAFLFATDGERIESALGAIGIRLEPDAIGPDIIKCFVSLFGWFALLASLRASVPTKLASWIPPDTSWSAIAGIAGLFAIVEAIAALAMRRALPWLGLQIKTDGLTAVAIKLILAVGVLALLVRAGFL